MRSMYKKMMYGSNGSTLPFLYIPKGFGIKPGDSIRIYQKMVTFIEKDEDGESKVTTNSNHDGIITIPKEIGFIFGDEVVIAELSKSLMMIMNKREESIEGELFGTNKMDDALLNDKLKRLLLESEIRIIE